MPEVALSLGTIESHCASNSACGKTDSRVVQGTIIGFDYGEKRIGVAIGDTNIGVAHPLTTIFEESGQRRFEAIARLISEWRPTALIVGIPYYQDGSDHEVTRLCRRFARRLEGRFHMKVELVDERYSSAAAEESLREIHVHGKKRKAVIDQVAAQTILQSFLDYRHHDTA